MRRIVHRRANESEFVIASTSGLVRARRSASEFEIASENAFPRIKARVFEIASEKAREVDRIIESVLVIGLLMGRTVDLDNVSELLMLSVQDCDHGVPPVGAKDAPDIAQT